jgi:hypothetical protein
MFGAVPRWLIVFGVVAVAGFELFRAFPDLLLIPQRLAGQTGEYEGKAQQGQLIAAQTAKTMAETQLAQTQAQLARTQAELNRSQAVLAQSQSGLAKSQSANTDLDSLNKAVGLAAVGALIYGGVKVYQAMHSEDGTQQSGASQDAPQRVTERQQVAERQSSSPRSATVTALKANLRTGPGVTYQSISTLPQGARVTVVREAENGWFEVDAFGEAGAPVHGFASGKVLGLTD